MWAFNLTSWHLGQWSDETEKVLLQLWIIQNLLIKHEDPLSFTFFSLWIPQQILCHLSSHLLYRSSRRWENHTTLDVSGVVYAMNAWMVFHSQSMLITKYTASTTTIACLLLNAPVVEKVNSTLMKQNIPKWLLPGITPVEGTEETVRVVSMDKDFHVDCYVCEECGMQLTDEPDKRCYPLDGRLLCRPCHIQRLTLRNSPNYNVGEPVSASYQYMNWSFGVEIPDNLANFSIK